MISVFTILYTLIKRFAVHYFAVHRLVYNRFSLVSWLFRTIKLTFWDIDWKNLATKTKVWLRWFDLTLENAFGTQRVNKTNVLLTFSNQIIFAFVLAKSKNSMSCLVQFYSITFSKQLVHYHYHRLPFCFFRIFGWIVLISC